jgi:hypothetical protein
MSNANPASALDPVILSPEMTAQHVAGLLLTGRTDIDAVTSWALDCPVNLRDPQEYAALNSMLASADMNKVFIKTLEREKTKSTKAAAVRVTFSEAGRAVLNNSVKMNQSKDGRGGVSLCLYPRELSQLLNDLPLMVAAVIDNAETKVKADATKTVEDDATKAARKAAGSKFDKNAARIVKHERAGLDCMDWTGTDKPAVIEKFRNWLTKHNVK